MTAYYNEFDPKAAAWLRELIRCGHIAPGDVDERSIEDVTPADLAGYTQVHMFAGIGVWSYALRRAGWVDDRPVWTGSCPCPPFSAAGKGSLCPSCGGKSCISHPVVTAGWICLTCDHEWRGDARHLLPELLRLVGQCRPPAAFGEQVASRDGRLWLYTLRVVMEALGYAVGAADLCAAGVGAPHIRQRLWWVGERLDSPAGARHFGPINRPEGLARHEARLRLLGAGSGPDGLADSDDAGLEGQSRYGAGGREPGRVDPQPAGPGESGGGSGGVADAHGRDARAERQQRGGEQRQQPQDGGTGGVADAHDAERRPIPARGDDSGGPDAGRAEGSGHAEGRGGLCGLADASREHLRGEPGERTGAARTAEGAARQRQRSGDNFGGHGPDGRPGPTNGLWRDADWLFCRDGKWRPVEPRSQPLVNGSPARVGRLRGYGNAIVAPAATAFIEACMDSFRLTDVSGVTTDKTDEGVFG